MKKKLALGLAHLMGPHRSDDRMPAALAVSPPPSPYPGRRAPLPTKVEVELRTACAGVLINTKPSHHYVPEDHSNAPKPQLDYDAVKRSASTRKSLDSRPAVPRTHSTEATHPVKYTYRPDAAVDQLFPPGDSNHDLVQSQLARRKDDAPLSARQKTPVPINIVSPNGDVNERPRLVQRSLSGGTNGSTPQTDVTEYPWSTSTAPTSAAITPARTSKRASSHMQTDQESSSKADATAIEWMRIELERRRKKQAAQEETPIPPPESRAPSRTRSIRNNIKEYIRPSTAGSASRESSRPVSRSASRASLRTASSDHDQSTRGWRSWGRSRKEDTKSDVSRSNSVRGRSEARKGSTPTKSDLNLNRELPPLPGLDQWKESDSVAPRHPPAPNHRSANSKHSRASKSVDSKMSEKDEIIAARLGSPVREKPTVYQTTRSPTISAGTKFPSFGAAYTHDTLASPTTQPDRIPQRSKSTTRVHSRDHAPTVRAVPATQGANTASTIVRKKSINYSRVRSPSNPTSTETNLPNAVAGFSEHRNYDSSNIPPALGNSKGDKAAHKHTYEQKYRHVMEVLRSRSPPPVPPKDDKKAWWHLKAKSKKPPNWMDHLEKMGVKDGMLDEACGAPVIRY